MFAAQPRLLLLAVFVLASATTVAPCVMPTGIGTGEDELDFSTLSFPSSVPPSTGILGAYARNAGTIARPLEVPVQSRVIVHTFAGMYNSGVAFEEKALDFFGRPDFSDSIRRCGEADGVDPVLFDQHRLVARALTALWGGQAVYKPKDNIFIDLAASWGLDLFMCEDPKYDCSDISTPWGLGQAIVADAADIFSRDGWNWDGSLSKTYNRIPYEDWRSEPYQPDRSCETCWQPLLEHDTDGFLFRQEHVTPHIGFTAKSFFVGDEKICARTALASNFDYDYEVEAELVRQRTADLNETEKVEIEMFDNKLTSIARFWTNQNLAKNISLDSFDFLLMQGATITVVYEAIIQAWRVKVLTDRIRPTTVLQSMYRDETITSYQGPPAGSAGPILGQEWQPYLRVMPHAEYPSGSSCICKAFARVATLFKGNDIVADIGEPAVRTMPAGTSNVEKNFPPNDVTLSFNTWDEIAERCGVSRLNGGMHFTAAVPDGEVMCEAIGDDIHAYFTALGRGEVPEFTADVGAEPTETRSCDDPEPSLIVGRQENFPLEESEDEP